MKSITRRETVSVAEVRGYLDEYQEWDEVLLKDEDRVFPLALGLNPRWHGDWTSVGTFQSLLDELFSWDGLGLRSRRGNYWVVGMECSEEPTLIVESM